MRCWALWADGRHRPDDYDVHYLSSWYVWPHFSANSRLDGLMFAQGIFRRSLVRVPACNVCLVSTSSHKGSPAAGESCAWLEDLARLGRSDQAQLLAGAAVLAHTKTGQGGKAASNVEVVSINTSMAHTAAWEHRAHKATGLLLELLRANAAKGVVGGDGMASKLRHRASSVSQACTSSVLQQI